MYGKRVNAVIWNDSNNPARVGDKRTRFLACYIFDDGYATLAVCKAAVPHPNKWAYVKFSNNWYAVNADSFYKVVVVTKEYVHTSTYNGVDSNISKCIPIHAVFDGIKKHNIGPRRWTDGVFQDLLRIDPNLEVVHHDGKIYDDPDEWVTGKRTYLSIPRERG